MEIKINNKSVSFYPSKTHKGFTGKYYIDTNSLYFLKKCPYRNIIRESTITRLLNENNCNWSLTLVKSNNKYIVTHYLDNSEYLNTFNIPFDYREQLNIMLKDMSKLNIRHNDIHIKQFRVLDGILYLTDFGWGSIKDTTEFKLPDSDRQNAYQVLDNLYNKSLYKYEQKNRVLPYFGNLFVGKISTNNIVLKINLPKYLVNSDMLRFETINSENHIKLLHFKQGTSSFIRISCNDIDKWKNNLELSHNFIYVENNLIELGKSKKAKKYYILYSNKPFPKKINFQTGYHGNISRFKYRHKILNSHLIILLVTRIDIKNGWYHEIPVTIK